MGHLAHLAEFQGQASTIAVAKIRGFSVARGFLDTEGVTLYHNPVQFVTRVWNPSWCTHCNLWSLIGQRQIQSKVLCCAVCVCVALVALCCCFPLDVSLYDVILVLEAHVNIVLMCIPIVGIFE